MKRLVSFLFFKIKIKKLKIFYSLDLKIWQKVAANELLKIIQRKKFLTVYTDGISCRIVCLKDPNIKRFCHPMEVEMEVETDSSTMEIEIKRKRKREDEGDPTRPKRPKRPKRCKRSEKTPPEKSKEKLQGCFMKKKRKERILSTYKVPEDVKEFFKRKRDPTVIGIDPGINFPFKATDVRNYFQLSFFFF
jgi:hypothetical protein